MMLHRSGMWCASNPRHAWLSDRFARVLARASCLCYFKGAVRFGPTRYFRCKRRRRQRDGQRRNSAIVGGGAGRHERRTSRNCRYLAASCDRRNSPNAHQRRRAPDGRGTAFLAAARLAAAAAFLPNRGETSNRAMVNFRVSAPGNNKGRSRGPCSRTCTPRSSRSGISVHHKSVEPCNFRISFDDLRLWVWIGDETKPAPWPFLFTRQLKDKAISTSGNLDFSLVTNTANNNSTACRYSKRNRNHSKCSRIKNNRIDDFYGQSDFHVFCSSKRNAAGSPREALADMFISPVIEWVVQRRIKHAYLVVRHQDRLSHLNLYSLTLIFTRVPGASFLHLFPRKAPAPRLSDGLIARTLAPRPPSANEAGGYSSRS